MPTDILVRLANCSQKLEIYKAWSSLKLGAIEKKFKKTYKKQLNRISIYLKNTPHAKRFFTTSRLLAFLALKRCLCNISLLNKH